MRVGKRKCRTLGCTSYENGKLGVCSKCYQRERSGDHVLGKDMVITKHSRKAAPSKSKGLAEPCASSRLEAVLAKEATQPACWWWLSFAEPGRNLGVLVIRANGVASASQEAWRIGQNPGGEMAAMALPDVYMERIPENMRNRLLNRAEAEGLGRVQ